MNELLKILSDFLTAFFDQPPRIIIVFGLVLFGWAWKKTPFNDRWIPFVLPVMGMIMFPVVLASGWADVGRCAVEGFVGGNIAVWINQAYRQAFVGKAGDKGLVTSFFTRAGAPPPPPPPPPAPSPKP